MARARIVLAIGLWCGGAALLLACGGGEEKPLAWGVTADAANAQTRVASSEGGPNGAPRIVRMHLEPMSPKPGDQVRIVAETRDPDGDKVRLVTVWKIDGVELHERGSELRLGSTVRSGQRVEVVVTPSDGVNEGEPARSYVEVVSQSIVWHEFRLEPEGDVLAGTEVMAVAVVEDPDGETLALEYSWRVNGRLMPEVRGEKGARFDTTGLERGDTIQVRVSLRGRDGERGFKQSEEKRIANREPRFVSKPGEGWRDGVFHYVMQVEDPDGDRVIRYRLDKGPDGMEVDAVLGELSWRPKADQDGVHEVLVAATDGHGGEAQQLFELTLSKKVSIEPSAPANQADR